MSWFDRLVRFSLPLVPRLIVRRVARRYIAGEQLPEAVSAVRALNAAGAMATLDVLGEEVRERSQVERAVADYGAALRAIRRERLDCNVSLKPTQFGLLIDERLCRDAIARVAALAAELGSFVRIDMEGHHTVDATLRIYRELRPEHEYQMLLGVDHELRRLILDEGHRLRVYTPFGIDWYAYSLRRLRENPTIARHVLRGIG